jgi:hypothetical protein
VVQLLGGIPKALHVRLAAFDALRHVAVGVVPVSLLRADVRHGVHVVGIVVKVVPHPVLVGDVADLVVGVGAVVGGRAAGGLGVGQAVEVVVGEGLCAVTRPGQLVRVKLAVIVDERVAPPRPVMEVPAFAVGRIVVPLNPPASQGGGDCRIRQSSSRETGGVTGGPEEEQPPNCLSVF